MFPVSVFVTNLEASTDGSEARGNAHGLNLPLKLAIGREVREDHPRDSTRRMKLNAGWVYTENGMGLVHDSCGLTVELIGAHADV